MSMTKKQEENLRRNISAFLKMGMHFSNFEGSNEAYEKTEKILVASRNHLFELCHAYITNDLLSPAKLNQMVEEELKKNIERN